MNDTAAPSGCPDCPPRDPRGVYLTHDGWFGCCSRHGTRWQLDGEPPAGVPVLGERPPECRRDVDHERVREGIVRRAGFTQAPVIALGQKFWQHPDRSGVVNTDEALELAKGAP